MLGKLKSLEDKLSPGLRKIILNIGWLFTERILYMVVSLLVGIYVVRYLGPEDFGKLSYSYSFFYLFFAIAKLGLNDIVVRDIVQQEKFTPKILGTAFVLKLFSSVISIILITSSIWLLNDDSQIRWMTIIIALGLLFDGFEVIDFWFQSQVLSRPIATVQSVQILLTAGARILFVFLKFPLISFAWMFFAEFLFKGLGSIWVYLKYRQSFKRWEFRWSTAVELLQDSIPMLLSAVMISIYMKIDQVMLQNLVGSKEVGIYAAAVRFSEIWYFVPMAICASVFPSVLKAKARSKREYDLKTQQLYDVMAWISLAISLVMTIVSQPLINILLGKEYDEAGIILALHIWSGPFVFLSVARGRWLIAEKLTRFEFMATSLGVVANICLNFYLIPLYGGKGAAIATLISYAFACYLAGALFPPLFKNTWMLTKALFIPFRIKQNLLYFKIIRQVFS
jgi:O-antigen/teichoic acid export membrane protein